MNVRLKENLTAIWLTGVLLSIILPVFVPSITDPHSIYANVIETAVTTLFIISLPASLLSIVLFYLESVVGLDPNRIWVMYLNIWALFALGGS